MFKKKNLVMFLVVSLFFINFISAYNFENEFGTGTTTQYNNVYIINSTEDIIHNNLTGLQGGATNQYYHIPVSWYNILTANIADWITEADADARYSEIKWAYNQTTPANDYTNSINNSLALWVIAQGYSTTGENSSWNESRANLLYAGIQWAYNQTTISNGYCDASILANTSLFTSTYNSTYAGLINNASYLSTYNSTYDAKISYNNTNLAYVNNSNTFTKNQNMSGNNITNVGCIILTNGGKIGVC